MFFEEKETHTHRSRRVFLAKGVHVDVGVYLPLCVCVHLCVCVRYERPKNYLMRPSEVRLEEYLSDATRYNRQQFKGRFAVKSHYTRPPTISTQIGQRFQ